MQQPQAVAQREAVTPSGQGQGSQVGQAGLQQDESAAVNPKDAETGEEKGFWSKLWPWFLGLFVAVCGALLLAAGRRGSKPGSTDDGEASGGRPSKEDEEDTVVPGGTAPERKETPAEDDVPTLVMGAPNTKPRPAEESVQKTQQGLGPAQPGAQAPEPPPHSPPSQPASPQASVEEEDKKKPS